MPIQCVILNSKGRYRDECGCSCPLTHRFGIVDYTPNRRKLPRRRFQNDIGEISWLQDVLGVAILSIAHDAESGRANTGPTRSAVAIDARLVTTESAKGLKERRFARIRRMHSRCAGSRSGLERTPKPFSGKQLTRVALLTLLSNRSSNTRGSEATRGFGTTRHQSESRYAFHRCRSLPLAL